MYVEVVINKVTKPVTGLLNDNFFLSYEVLHICHYGQYFQLHLSSLHGLYHGNLMQG